MDTVGNCDSTPAVVLLFCLRALSECCSLKLFVIALSLGPLPEACPGCAQAAAGHHGQVQAGAGHRRTLLHTSVQGEGVCVCSQGIVLWLGVVVAKAVCYGSGVCSSGRAYRQARDARRSTGKGALFGTDSSIYIHPPCLLGLPVSWASLPPGFWLHQGHCVQLVLFFSS